MDEQTDVLTPAPPPPASQPERPPVRRLTRRVDDKVVAGVCSGLGDYFDVDPVLFRVGFIVVTLAGGLGILIYALAWWFVPPATGPGPAATGTARGRVAAHRISRRMRRSPRWVGLALLIVGGAYLFTHVGPAANDFGFLRPSVVWGLALILLGVLIYQRSGERDEQDRPQPAAPVEREPAALIGAEGTPAPVTPPPVGWAGTAVAAPSPPPDPRRHRERSALGWVTIGMLCLAVGAAALLDQGGAIHLTAVRFLALAMTVLGVGLLVGTFWGRARWLFLPGLLLAPLVLAASLIHVPFAGGIGQRFYHPVTVSDVRPVYRMTAGELDLNLLDVSFGNQHVSITATIVAGTIYVSVPRYAVLTVHAAVGAGRLEVLSEPFDHSDGTADGVKARIDQTYGPTTAPTQIDLYLQAGFGQITVFRAAPVPSGA